MRSLILLLNSITEEPHAPLTLAQRDMFYNENKPIIKLIWSPPDYDGNAPITHYVVEHKPETSAWKHAHRDKTTKTEFVLTDVEMQRSYSVRVSATNNIGTGPPSEVLSVKVPGK